jgi:ABC-type multidrug transport system fused ATPase/permease subunit
MPSPSFHRKGDSGVLSTEPTPGIPDLNALMPAWAQQLSLVGLLILIIASFVRGWVITKRQNESDLASERRVSEIWQKNAETANSQVDRLTTALTPVLDGNAAILRAVTEVQEEQRRMRDYGDGRRAR